MGRIFKTVCLMWVPTGKIFTFSITKVDSESPHGSNTYITNLHECIQTLDSSAATSINVQEQQTLDLSTCTPFNLKKERIKAWIKENVIYGRPWLHGITLIQEISARQKSQGIRKVEHLPDLEELDDLEHSLFSLTKFSKPRDLDNSETSSSENFSLCVTICSSFIVSEEDKSLAFTTHGVASSLIATSFLRSGGIKSSDWCPYVEAFITSSSSTICLTKSSRVSFGFTFSLVNLCSLKSRSSSKSFIQDH
ncbi:hypothetical protein Tco_1173818 [Tanacetum coccineum]